MNKYIATAGLATLMGAGIALGNPALEAKLADFEKRLAKYENNSGNVDAVSVMPRSNWADKTSIGGYGELHANFDLDNSDNNEIDFHRFVLFVNHEFNDKIRLVSELELEHSLAGDGKNGEIELEQAYIEMDLANQFQVKAGLFLVPVGILNETHEPNTFFGVERNNVEKHILPSTWWEAGLSVNKKFDNGLSFDFALTSGLSTSNQSIRSGRGKVSQARLSDAAFTGRVSYVGIAGLKLTAFGQYQTDIDQDNNEDNAATLFGGTAEYSNGGFALRALFSQWNIDGASYDAVNADKQNGFYIEPSYTWDLQNGHKVGVFSRYSEYNYFKGTRHEVDETSFGVNYWPHDNVVLKADYVNQKEAGDNNESVNLGVGYQF